MNSDIAKMKELKTKHLKAKHAAKHAVEAIARYMGEFEMKQKKSEEEAAVLRMQFRYTQLIEQKNKAMDIFDEATNDDQEKNYEETASAADLAAEAVLAEADATLWLVGQVGEIPAGRMPQPEEPRFGQEQMPPPHRTLCG